MAEKTTLITNDFAKPNKGNMPSFFIYKLVRASLLMAAIWRR